MKKWKATCTDLPPLLFQTQDDATKLEVRRTAVLLWQTQPTIVRPISLFHVKIECVIDHIDMLVDGILASTTQTALESELTMIYRAGMTGDDDNIMLWNDWSYRFMMVWDSHTQNRWTELNVPENALDPRYKDARRIVALFESAVMTRYDVEDFCELPDFVIERDNDTEMELAYRRLYSKIISLTAINISS